VQRRKLLLGLAAIAAMPMRTAHADDASITVSGVRMSVQQVVAPADPASFSLAYWNHDVVGALQVTVTNTGSQDVVFRRSQLGPSPPPLLAEIHLTDDAGHRLDPLMPFEDSLQNGKRVPGLWTAMPTDQPTAMTMGDPLLKAGATATGWVYFLLPEAAHPDVLGLQVVSDRPQFASIDLRQVPSSQVDPSAYAAINAERAAYRPDLEPKAMIVPPEQMPGTWDSPKSSYSSGLGQVDATYYDLTDLGRGNRAMRLVMRDRKTGHNADVETGRRATTFSTFTNAHVDQVDGLGDGLAFRAVYDLPELIRTPGSGMPTMTHLLYGFRVERFGLELSMYQPGVSDADLQDLLDGVVGLQIDRIRSALGR
jgi:hypothetical protein